MNEEPHTHFLKVQLSNHNSFCLNSISILQLHIFVAYSGGSRGRMGGMHPPPARTMLPFEKVETRVRTIGLSVLFQPPDDDADG